MHKTLIAIAAVGATLAVAGLGSSRDQAWGAASAESKAASASSPRHIMVTTASAKTAHAESARDAHSVQISAKVVHGLGKILVNAKGQTLYTFAPDKHSKVTCKGGCAAIWPPAFLSPGQKETATKGVRRSLLGSDRDGTKRVITYNGWPLYTYITDGAPGRATGQDIDLNGGLWYVIAPSGRVIKKKAR